MGFQKSPAIMGMCVAGRRLPSSDVRPHFETEGSGYSWRDRAVQAAIGKNFREDLGGAKMHVAD